MKHLSLFLMIGIACLFGCSKSEQTVSSDRANDTMAYDKSDITGTWLLVEFGSPIPSPNETITFAVNGNFFDSMEDGPFSYDIKDNRLVIEDFGWGKQEFNIIKLTRDSLYIQQYRQQIYSDSIDKILQDEPIEKYVRFRHNFER